MTALPVSLTEHPLYPELQPYIQVTPTKDAKGRRVRVRIELRNMPAALGRRALKVKVACPACGGPHFPLRRRQGPIKRGPDNRVGIYYAATCPLSVNVACSRGHAASREYNLIESSMKKWVMASSAK